MNEAGIRAQIYDILGDVADIGTVYDYERWAKDWDTFIALFKTTIGGTAQIRGWEIYRPGPVPDDPTSVRSHTYAINGYMSLKDSAGSEKIFNTLIEAVYDAFLAKPDLNDAALGHDGIQVNVIEPRMFGSVLCHYCRLTLVCHEHKYG
jgi:hypothetical protein